MATTVSAQQVVVLRCGGGARDSGADGAEAACSGPAAATFTRPLADLLRYPDSLLRRLVADVGELRAPDDASEGSPSPSPSSSHPGPDCPSTLELDLGTSCDAASLAVALHVHSTGSICGAPLPADVTLDWLTAQVLDKFGLPPLTQLDVTPLRHPAAAHTLPTLTRLLRAAAVDDAARDVLCMLPLEQLLKKSCAEFVFGAHDCRLDVYRVEVQPDPHADPCWWYVRARDGSRLYLLDAKPYPAALAPQLKDALARRLKALYPGCTAEWKCAGGKGARTPDLDVLCLGWHWDVQQ